MPNAQAEAHVPEAEVASTGVLCSAVCLASETVSERPMALMPKV